MSIAASPKLAIRIRGRLVSRPIQVNRVGRGSLVQKLVMYQYLCCAPRECSSGPVLSDSCSSTPLECFRDNEGACARLVQQGRAACAAQQRAQYGKETVVLQAYVYIQLQREYSLRDCNVSWGFASAVAVAPMVSCMFASIPWFHCNDTVRGGMSQ